MTLLMVSGSSQLFNIDRLLLEGNYTLKQPFMTDVKTFLKAMYPNKAPLMQGLVPSCLLPRADLFTSDLFKIKNVCNSDVKCSVLGTH